MKIMKYLGLAFVAVVIVAVGFNLLMHKKSTAATAAPVSAAAGTASGQSQAKKFSDSPFAPYGIVISDATLSAEASTALTGFDLTRTAQGDGRVMITLKAKTPRYADQSYSVKPGQKLYFIETSGADDRGTQDNNLSDDTAVAVDANGFIIS